MNSNHRGSRAPSYNRRISAYFVLLIVVLSVTLVVAVALYGEPFSWGYAFSDLGSTATWAGKVNVPARLVFTLGGVSAGWIMLQVWAAYTGEVSFRNQRAKRDLAALGTVGFLLSSVSNSQHHIIHTIGAVCAFASLYLFTMFFYFELRADMPQWRFMLELAVLQAVVFSYALAFFADWPSKQGFQKACVLGVFYAVLRAATAGQERIRLQEMLGAFRQLHGKEQR